MDTLIAIGTGVAWVYSIIISVFPHIVPIQSQHVYYETALIIHDAILISKATIRNIKQNLFGAFIYNVIGIPIAAGILYPLIGMLLNPMVAGAAMAASSLTVVSNANRLRLLKIKRE